MGEELDFQLDNYVPGEDNGDDGLDPSTVLSHFPYPTFRHDQERVIQEAADAIAAGKHVLIEAPVGFGKSPAAITLARWAGSCMITTPVNSLVDQYEEDFPELAVIKGRANYPCHRNGKTADVGACLTERGIVCQCPYKNAKDRAAGNDDLGIPAAPVVMTSMAMAMTAPYLRRKREIVIVDEAHNVETSVLGHISPVLDPTKFSVPPPATDDWDKHIQWLERIAYPEAMQRADQAQEVYDALRSESALKDLERANRDAYRLSSLMNDYEEHEEPWVVIAEKTARGDDRVKYLPVSGSRFVRSKILTHAKVGIFMSGTPPTLQELGLEPEDVVVVRTGMNFPIENRPILREYRGKMSFKCRDETMPKMAEAIAELAEGPTIVHAHSYGIAKSLSYHLNRMRVRHILQDGSDRMRALDQFMQSNGETVIWLSVNMTEGINLKDDACRVQLLCKTPWPNIMDPWIKKRTAVMGEDVIAHSIVRAIVQAYGRAVRSETDHAKFYVLDSDFAFFLSKHRDKFPQYFLEAISRPGGGKGLGAFATA